MTGEVVATYELDGSFPLADAARVVAMEQTTGTWTRVAKRRGSLEDQLAGRVESVHADPVPGRPNRGTARISYPVEIFEVDNLPGFLAIVAGNLFGLGSLTRCRWKDIEFPDSFVRRYPGPQFGVEGVRQAVGSSASGRPHGGTIIKPKVGLDPKGTAAVAKEAALGGLDLIKDDETLTDQAFCPLEERARLVLEALDQARSETGKTTLYAVNLTGSAADIVDRWERVRQYGPNCVMMDVLTSGYDALVELRNACNVPIHVHRAMHGAITRSPDYGIDMLVVSRLVRMAGGDQLHVGSASGKMEHPSHLGALTAALRDPWHGLKPTFPVSSGGLHPASVEAEIEGFGSDVVLQAGGGIHGHPHGTRAGATAFMQAIQEVHAGRRVRDTRHPELQEALRAWGHETYSYAT